MEAREAVRWLRRRPWVLCLPALLWLRGCSASEEGYTTQAAPATTSGPAGQACATFSGKTCDQCIQNTSCLWCNEKNTCMDYPVTSLIPSSALCSLSEARWGICWVNFQALIISIAVIAGLLLLTIVGCCCYCCCCRGRHRGYRFPFLKAAQQTRLAEEEERFIRDREEKRLQSLQRKHERKAKHDEIRKKYVQIMNNPFYRTRNLGSADAIIRERLQKLCSRMISTHPNTAQKPPWLPKLSDSVRDLPALRGLLQDSDHPYSRYENE